MDPITAYQLTSMMEGVVQRGTAAGTVNLPVPVAGKTGTTNEARDVWFVGFTSNIVAGCYIGYDQPRSAGRGASGGGMCGPVFTEFMQDAVRRIRRHALRRAPGRALHPIDRRTGAAPAADSLGRARGLRATSATARSPSGAAGALIDGGFGMGANLPMFSRGEDADADEPGRRRPGGTRHGRHLGGAGGCAATASARSVRAGSTDPGLAAGPRLIRPADRRSISARSEIHGRTDARRDAIQRSRRSASR
jgi:penicillin-binding protein 1A